MTPSPTRTLIRPTLALAAATLLGCGGPHKSAPAAAAPVAAAKADAPLTLETAEVLIAELTARHAKNGGVDPLAQPASVDDVLEILRRDQLDLFGAGVAFMEKVEGPEGAALRAQLELSWAEACTMAADALGDQASRLAKHANRIREEGDEAEADALTATATQLSRAADALLLVADPHMARGREAAQKVIAAAPDSYLGYRVAADYYRLHSKWEDFDKMITQIEATNPNSNGLVFLRGAAAAQRDFDFEKASSFYREALTRDPKFTRAQMALMLGQGNVGDLHAEFQKLAALNPKHHLVLWAKAAIEADYAQWQKEQAASEAAAGEPATKDEAAPQP